VTDARPRSDRQPKPPDVLGVSTASSCPYRLFDVLSPILDVSGLVGFYVPPLEEPIGTTAPTPPLGRTGPDRTEVEAA
jgi:hypothetical protein